MIRHLIKTYIAAPTYCRSYVRRMRQVKNPGLNNQIKVLSKNVDTEYHPEDADDYSQFESDFQAANKTHRQYEKEAAEHREKIKHMTVRTKYFKTAQLNFLTWSEKEQIRHLHAKDPEEWCIEHLAESFPADTLVISKILQSNWVPQNEARTRKHDESVRKTWKLLAENNIGDIDPDFKIHLKKFSNRNLPIQSNAAEVNKNKPSIPMQIGNNEFSQIITNCKKYSQNTTENTTDDKIKTLSSPAKKPAPETDTFLLGKVNQRKPLLFRELDIAIETNNNRMSAEPQHNPFTNPRDAIKKEIAATVNINLDNHVQKYSTNEVQTTEDEIKKLSMPAIRDQIEIPKQLYRQGATYKLDDCYYDDDGEFLYRVPGMTGRD